MEEIIYNVLAILIVAAALFVAVRKVYHKINPKKKSSCGDGCGGCSSDCQIKDLVQKQKASQ